MPFLAVTRASATTACRKLARRLAAMTLGLGAVGLVSGCALPLDVRTEAFVEGEARRLFADAFGHIQDRYIEPVAIAPLALNGLYDLLAAQSGSSLRLQDRGGVLTVMARGGPVAQFRRPDADDADGWAEVTAGVVERAAAAAPQLRALPAEAVYKTVLDGVVGLLDPFSRYSTRQVADQQRAVREGFDGIGISILTKDGITHVVEVLEGTPAAGSDLAVGDRITHVDGDPLAGLDAAAVVDRLRGPTGSVVLLDVLRADPPQPLRFSVLRAHIVPVTVHTSLDGGLAVIRVSSFNRNTNRDLERQYRSLPQGRVRGVILDLRDNPGGLLDQAVLTADLFLSNGVVVSAFGRHPAASSVFTADPYQIAASLPMAVLANGGSASSAELLAAALQDRGRAVVIGTTTHGKGSVQNLTRLPNGGELIITWSRLHAPSGYILDGLGVLPSICTTEPLSVDNLSQVFQRLDAYADRAARWQHYNHVDAPLAAALRSGCPAGKGDRDSDLAVARRLLHNPALYERALRRTLESADAALLRANDAS